MGDGTPLPDDTHMMATFPLQGERIETGQLFHPLCTPERQSLCESHRQRRWLTHWSYGRLCGPGILDYREQSRDDFSRPFGKEAPYANAYERNRFESSQATRLNRAVGLYFGLLV